MAGFRNTAQYFRIVGGVLADGEERREYALTRQRLDDCGGGRPRTIVEGQNDFLITQEVMLLEMLEAESRSASRIDFDDAGYAKCSWVPARRSRVCGSIAAGGLGGCFGTRRRRNRDLCGGRFRRCECGPRNDRACYQLRFRDRGRPGGLLLTHPSEAKAD